MGYFLSTTAIISTARNLVPDLPAGTYHKALYVGKAYKHGIVHVPEAADA